MKLAENRSARSHAHGRRQDRQRDGRDLSMGLSMNCSLSMPLQTGQTALTAAIQAWDRSFGAGQATCKAVVRRSSLLTGSTATGMPPLACPAGGKPTTLRGECIHLPRARRSGRRASDAAQSHKHDTIWVCGSSSSVVVGSWGAHSQRMRWSEGGMSMHSQEAGAARRRLVSGTLLVIGRRKPTFIG